MQLLGSRPQLSLAASLGLATSLCASLFVLGAHPALAELKYTTTYRQNPIRGTTPQQLWRHMASHLIADEDGPALANITHDHQLAVRTRRAGGVCQVSAVDFTWRFVITLPEAVDEARMSRATRAMWTEFTGYLKNHEEHHRTIFVGCGKDFLAKAAKLTTRGSCLSLKRTVRRFIDKQYDICMAKQRAFDRDDRSSFTRLALSRAHRK